MNLLDKFKDITNPFSPKIIGKMNVLDKFKDVKNPFSPKIIGEINDSFVKIAIIDGDKIPWHNHKAEDELFYILEGRLLFEIEGEDSFMMNQGDLFIVKKGINHRVSSNKPCKIMLVENKSTAHTGTVKSEITKTISEQL
ncbi:MAG: cupin domain-containing protein [Crocinitomicaceae bacterium]|nr:cupin domain-containing protein [Crocinitomicaceae bacterium]